MLDAIRQRPDRTPATFFRYDSYGTTKAFQRNGTPIAAGFELTDLLYTGQRWDAHSRLYYYQARFYDPRIAQFVSTDPAREYPNPYAYVGWNPLSFTDPTGLYSEKDEFVDDDGTVYSAETVEVTATAPSPPPPTTIFVEGTLLYTGQVQTAENPAEYLNVAKDVSKGVIVLGTIASRQEKGFISRLLKRLTSRGAAKTIPEKAADTLQQIERTGKPPPGYFGGRTFKNAEGRLPAGGKYREYDVDPKPLAGASRNAERVVVDENTGRAWYTGDHYGSFTRIK